MQKETVVSSYVRHSNKQEVETVSENHHTLALVMLGAMGIILAVVYIQLTLGLGLVLGAAYGVKALIGNNPRTVAVEAPVEAENKPKRHYSSRIQVNHYQLKKPVRV